MTTTADLDRELDEMAEHELRKDAEAERVAAVKPATALATLPSVDDKNLAVLTHVGTAAAAALSGGLLHVIVPAVALVAFKDKDEFVRQHARNQLNFQLTYLAALLAAVVLTVVTFGLGIVVALPAVLFFWVLDLVTSIRAALAAGRGEAFEFPWSLRLLQ